MAGGRPTKYSPAVLEKTREYAENYRAHGDPVPTIAALALILDVDRTTIHAWSKEAGKEEFSYLLTRIELGQERELVSGGIKGEFNPAITKMMLTKHGYTDKVEQTHQGPNGGPVEQAVSLTINFVKP